jgi:predicted ATP-grasp superfamily ATP-dependent carboligase
MACGLNFPYIQYCDALGQAPVHIAPRYDYHWVRLITDIPAGLQEIQAGLTTPGLYFHSFSGNTVFSVLDWHDPLPALGDFTAIAISKVRRRIYKK